MLRELILLVCCVPAAIMSQRNICILPPHLFCSLFGARPNVCCTGLINSGSREGHNIIMNFVWCFPLKPCSGCSNSAVNNWCSLMLSTVLMKGLMLLSTPTFWSTLQAPAPTYLQVRVIISLSPRTKPDAYSLEMPMLDHCFFPLVFSTHKCIFKESNLYKQQCKDFLLNVIKWKTSYF